MKAGLTTSVVLHVALLTFGLVSLSAPKPLDAGASEALPVDIVPISEFAEMVEGDKTAAISDKPAPKPTTKPQAMPDAKNAGDNDADLETPPTPEARPQEVKVASAPPPPPPKSVVEPEPQPKPPEPKPESVKAPQPAPKPPAEQAKAEPAPAPEPEPKPDAEPLEQAKPEPPEPPEPKVQPKPVETAEAKPEPDQVTLPDSAPSPLSRPEAEVAPKEKPVETKVADAAQAKPEKTKKDSTAKAKADSGEALEDEVAMLLNKQKPSGGGAKRSQAQKASLGNSQTTGAKLSQSEMDALSGQLAGCWSIPAGAEGAEGMRVSVRFHLDASGQLEGAPSIDSSSGDRSFDQSAVRAVQKCNREGFTLPKDKSDTWAEVVVNFDPSEMF